MVFLIRKAIVLILNRGKIAYFDYPSNNNMVSKKTEDFEPEPFDFSTDESGTKNDSNSTSCNNDQVFRYQDELCEDFQQEFSASEMNYKQFGNDWS